MRWFRSNIRRVSHVALFALAVQFALSFGHFHGVADQAASNTRSGAAQSAFLVADNLAAQVAHNPSAPRPAPRHGSGDRPGDICAICAVAMANAALFATPPTVLLPQAFDFSYKATTAQSVRILPVRVAFQPRAPPVS